MMKMNMMVKRKGANDLIIQIVNNQTAIVDFFISATDFLSLNVNVLHYQLALSSVFWHTVINFFPPFHNSTI